MIGHLSSLEKTKYGVEINLLRIAIHADAISSLTSSS